MFEVASSKMVVPLVFDYWLSKKGFLRLMSAVGTNAFNTGVQAPRLIIGHVKTSVMKVNATGPVVNANGTIGVERMAGELEAVSEEDKLESGLTKIGSVCSISHPVAPTAATFAALRVPTPNAQSATFHIQFNWPLSGNSSAAGPVLSLSCPTIYRIASYMNHACDHGVTVYPLPPYTSGRVRFVAARDIRMGEELTWYYGNEDAVSVNYRARCQCDRCRLDVATDFVNAILREKPEDVAKEMKLALKKGLIDKESYNKLMSKMRVHEEFLMEQQQAQFQQQQREAQAQGNKGNGQPMGGMPGYGPGSMSGRGGPGPQFESPAPPRQRFAQPSRRKARVEEEEDEDDEPSKKPVKKFFNK